MKQNFITDQGSIRASVSCARRVGSPRACGRLATAIRGGGPAWTGRAGLAGGLALALDFSDESCAVTLAATPDKGAGGLAAWICAGYGGAGR